MSSLVGSGYGAWRFSIASDTDILTVSRHEPGETRVFWDYDRAPPGWRPAWLPR
jgi:hypothetical protein